MHRSHAFTLIELLTVIAIIAILTAVAIPTVMHMRKQARLTSSLSNLRQTGVAMALYVGDHRGELPGRNKGSGYDLGVGDRGIGGSVKARFYSSNIDYLAPYLAPYTDVTEQGNGLYKTIPCLQDSLTASQQTGTSDNPVLWVLNRRLTPANYPGLERELNPFGLASMVVPERYNIITASVAPARVWAMMQADLKLPDDASLISAGTVSGTPLEPVAGDNRLALFFDWSVGKIPVGTNLNKPIDNRR